MRGVVERVTRRAHGHRRRVDIVTRACCATTPAPWRRSGSTSASWRRCWRRACASACAAAYRPQGGRASFVVQRHEILEDEDGETVHTEGIVPVYPASEQVSARLLRDLLHAVRPAMRRLPDPLPGALRARRGPARAADAVLAMHLPRDMHEALAARERLVLEELLLMQLGLLRHKRSQQARVAAWPLPAPDELSRAFLDGLPFELTDAPARGAGRARSRPAARAAHAPPAAGRRGLGQDGGRRCTVWCAPRRPASRARSWRPPRRWPAQHADTAARLVGRPRGQRAAHGLAGRRRSAAPPWSASPRARRSIVIGTHALIQERRALRATWPCWSSTSSTASAWSSATRWCAARRAARARAARAAHDGHAHPAHAGAHRVRRPRRDHHRGLARGPQAGGHAPRRRGAARGRLRLRAGAARQGPAGLRGLPGHRGVRVHRSRPPRSPRPSACKPGPFRDVTRRGGARPAQVGGARRRHGRLQARRGAACWSPPASSRWASTCPTPR